MMKITASPMKMSVRLRPDTNNVFDTSLLTIGDGGFKLAGQSTQIALAKDYLGEHRITLVVTNDNAGYAAGVSASEAGLNADESCKSNLTISLYIDGVLLGSTTIKSYITFGCDYAWSGTNNKGNPATSSTKVETVQFYSSFTPGTGVNDEVYLKNLIIQDTAYTPAQ